MDPAVVVELQLRLITEIRADIRASISAIESLQQPPSPPPALAKADDKEAHLSLNPLPELEMAEFHHHLPIAQDCTELDLIDGVTQIIRADAQTTCEPTNLDLHLP
jgi:hypothetical protein